MHNPSCISRDSPRLVAAKEAETFVFDGGAAFHGGIVPPSTLPAMDGVITCANAKRPDPAVMTTLISINVGRSGQAILTIFHTEL